MSPSFSLLFFLPVLKEDPKTGGEVYNRKLVDGLRKQGFSIEVLTLEEVVGTHARPGMAIAWRIFKKLRSYKDHVILYDTWLYKFVWPILWLLRLFSTSRLISFSQLCYWDTYQSIFYRNFHRILTLFALVPAHENVGVSNTILRNDLGIFFRFCKKHVVFPGCDFVSARVDLADCARMPVEIISVGSYGPRKGYHVLIEALAIIAKSEPSWLAQLRLRLVGDFLFSPEYVAQLKSTVQKERLEPYVIFDGWKDRTEIDKLYSQSQLFAFASVSEGFGMVILEALLHGLPVLLANFPVAYELLGESGAGYIVARQPEAFARKIIEYLQNDERKSLGAIARKRAETIGLSWEDVVVRFMKLLTHS